MADMTDSKAVRRSKLPSRGDVIRIGYVPLCDCAPVVMAEELGLFPAHGLRVELSREVGWATIRDKIALRELDAAHAPAAMVLAISLGIGAFKIPCVTGLVLNLHGNGITLSHRLWAAGVRDAQTFGDFVRFKRNGTTTTLGVAFSCSSHNFLLQQWLRGAGVDPMRDVNIVVVPPPQMAANLKAGNLDGYCVGEPWNSLAVVQRAGWVTALSPTIARRHPEKVLLVRADFAESHAEEHERLIAAVHESCEFCQRPESRQKIAELLSGPKYLKVNREAIQRSLCGPFKIRPDQESETMPELHVFAGPDVNEPGLDKAVWALQSLIEAGVVLRPGAPSKERLAFMFRADIFHSALEQGRKLKVQDAGLTVGGSFGPADICTPQT